MGRKRNDDDLIRAAIKELHRRGRSDYESLIRQAGVRRLEYNVPQMLASMSRAKVLVNEWGRGTGKTTILADRIRRCVLTMPRSTGLFIGPSYQFILTRIIPSLVRGLDLQGLYKDLHYFIGRRPPASWRRTWGTAFQPPDKYDRYITFWNGTGIHLISHDVPGDGRGLNTDWIVADECALLDQEKLQENTDPTLRGTNTRRYLGTPYFGTKMYVSSTPLTPKGRWFIEMEEKARTNPDKYQFLSFSCKWNLHNLRPGYLEDARESAFAEWVFEAEYLNIRPRMVKDAFYALLNEDKHAYEQFDYNYYTSPDVEVNCQGDADLDKDRPLILGVDWGAAINCMAVCQFDGKVFRALKSFYVLGDRNQTQEDLFKEFARYYSAHRRKEAFLWYDNSGNIATGITKYTRAELAKDQLEKLGWRVSLMTTGKSNPMHEQKHVLWNMILQEEDPFLPQFRINKSNARDLWISMTNAQIKVQGNTIKKDKRGERAGNPRRQHATDLSDAIDAAVYGMFAHLLNDRGVRLPDVKV